MGNLGLQYLSALVSCDLLLLLVLDVCPLLPEELQHLVVGQHGLVGVHDLHREVQVQGPGTRLTPSLLARDNILI